jgi:hypothetical protein
VRAPDRATPFIGEQGERQVQEEGVSTPVTAEDLVLKYSHNIVEHLGLKLYQNKPTNVIAEIISNSWDADAARVEVATSMEGANRWTAVLDDGHGMTRHELASAYLVIGQPRRLNADDKSQGLRRLMGRKGIGKLAPFGIAQQMDVVTCAAVDGKTVVHWLRFSLDELLKNVSGAYRPTLVVDGGDLKDLPFNQDPTGGKVRYWRDFIKQGKSVGTLVLMTSLSLGRAINDAQLIDSLGHRFTIAAGGHNFSVRVNGKLATTENMLPEFDFRIPDQGQTVETVGDREVKYWVGFVKKADWPTDQAGVGVYSHGKIAQDRPFTFGAKGKEIFARYMFGVVEAEWLDELDTDVISTDRTSVNWELPETKPLYDWGQKKVGNWVGKFEEWRSTLEQDDNRVLVRDVTRAGQAPKVTEPEEEEIVRLVSRITPSLGKDTDEKKRLVKAVSDAWVQAPMRKLVKDLWESVGKGSEMPPAAFTKVVERLSAHSVPESLNLAIVFAQRAFALTRLHDYVHHGDEVDLQRLVTSFPWIVEPDLAVLTANQQLKTAIAKAEDLGQITTGRRGKVAGIPETNRPDFVFLSSPEEHQILVVELKNPQEDLTIENRKQLEDYMTWFEEHYPDAEIRGYLIGRKPNKMDAKYEGMKILAWTEVLARSRARNLELLAAMLLKTGSGGADDARVADAITLGGPEAKALLERLAGEHKELKDLMASFEVIKKKSSPAKI